MSLARSLLLAALFLAAGTVQAGTLHPTVQAMMDRTPADQPMSVVVNLVSQAPIAQLNEVLHVRQATRQERHMEVITALQSVMNTQASLQGYLDSRMAAGSVLGYTRYWITNAIVVQATQDEIRQIADRRDVDVVELTPKPELIRPIRPPGLDASQSETTPQGTRGIGVTPGLRAIKAPEVWYQLGFTGAGRLIGGLDTGVDGNHPALRTRWRGYQGQNPWQECWLDLLGGGTQFPSDGNDHGTHTMGTMTGLGAATQDTIGVAWGAQWISCNAINQIVTPAFDSDILTAFQWFADPDGNPNTVDDVPDVVQNSWGVNEGFSQTPPYTDCDTRWWAVIDNCEAAGVCVTWSAGNEGPTSGSLRSPADRATTFTNCFSVGAVDATNYSWPYPIASWSSRGPSGCNVPAPQKLKPEVVAPGVHVYSSVPGGGYDDNFWDGTSMAGPHVAGIVALIRQANPNMDVDTIKQILMDTSRDEGTAGEDNTYGWGFIDAYSAVLASTVGFGNIEGHITNASWHNVPVQGARVTLLETGVRFTSDANGYYHGAAAAGSYTAEASKAGFQTVTIPVEITANQLTTQDFGLTDIAGPEISNVTQNGTTSDTSGPYLIEATVTDYSSVASVKLYFRVNNGLWTEVVMQAVAGTYQGNIPGMPSGTQIDYYVWAQDGIGLTTVSPLGAPVNYYTLYVTQTVYAYTAEDPGDPNWALGVAGDNATTGIWIRDDPVGTNYNGVDMQPEDDHTPAPGVKCFVTGNGAPGGPAGDNDVDGGCTTLQSPLFDLTTAQQGFITYYRWYGEGGNSTDDEFAIDVSSDGGTTWLPLERVPDIDNAWRKVTKKLNDYITLTNQVRFRFKACDLNNPGLVEAAIDDVSVDAFIPSGVGVSETGRPAQAVGLAQNEPNPFGPVTTIRFRLSNPAQARLEIFDTAGRMVRTLVDGPLQSGVHNVSWNGLDDTGKPVAAGVYFYHLKAGAFEQSRRMTILR